MRTAFFISDGTGITAETLARSLLTQFPGTRFHEIRIPFVNDVDRAHACVTRIKRATELDGARPIVFSTLINPDTIHTLKQTDALYIDLFQQFIGALENELNTPASLVVGRSHSIGESSDYHARIEAIDYTMSHDDGVSSDSALELADLILVGVSRSGKTPTSLYLAMQFGIKTANYPLIPEDFERMRLPRALDRHRGKLFGLMISPERLALIRAERRPDSHYAALDNCRREIVASQKMLRNENIPWVDSTAKSIEEISATIMQAIGLERHTW